MRNGLSSYSAIIILLIIIFLLCYDYNSQPSLRVSKVEPMGHD